MVRNEEEIRALRKAIKPLYYNRLVLDRLGGRVDETKLSCREWQVVAAVDDWLKVGNYLRTDDLCKAIAQLGTF